MNEIQLTSTLNFDWRRFLGPTLLALSLVVLSIYGVFNTANLAASEKKLHASALHEPQLADPAATYVEIYVPPAPMPWLSGGFTGIAPSIHLVRLSSTRPLSNVAPIEHPARRSFGRVELSFVLIILMPVILLPLAFTLSRQLEGSPALGKLLSGKVSLFDFALENIALPLSAWVGVTLVSILATLYSSGLRIESNESLARLSLWALLVALYATFWLLLFTWLLLRTRDFLGAAFRYSILLVLITLVVPALSLTVAQAITRTHSRLPLILSRKEVSNQGPNVDRNKINAFFASKKLPAVDWSQPIPPRVANLWMSLAAEQELRPQVEAFEQSLRTMDLISLGSSWLSPATSTQFAFDELAGTGLERYSQFREQSIRFSDQWADFMLPHAAAQRPLDYDLLRAAPKFTFKEEATSSVYIRSLLRVFYLLLLIGGLAGLVFVEANRMRTAAKKA